MKGPSLKFLSMLQLKIDEGAVSALKALFKPLMVQPLWLYTDLQSHCV
jgi:hypothetical protein